MSCERELENQRRRRSLTASSLRARLGLTVHVIADVGLGELEVLRVGARPGL